MEKELITLEENNRQAMEEWEGTLNGIACPVCSKELRDKRTFGIMLGGPFEVPKSKTYCTSCQWEGIRFRRRDE